MLSAHELESLTRRLEAVHAVGYMSAAMFTIMVYDMLLTMPREIRFIWRGNVSLRKVMYLISRYYALASLGVIAKMTISRNIPIKVTAVPTSIGLLGLVVSEALVNLLLILRINALYGNKKKVLFLILTIYSIEVALFVFAGLRAGEALPLSPLPADLSFPGCLAYIKTEPSFMITLAAWVPALVLSAVLLAFSVYKVLDDVALTTNRRLWSFNSCQELHPLLLSIFREGMLFYVVNTVITLLNAALILRIHTVVNTIAVPLGIAAYSFCGCRFLLNFYELSNKESFELRHIDGTIIVDDGVDGTSMQLTPL